MPTKNEAIQFDGKGASYAKFLNTDVDLIVNSTDGKQVDNMIDMVNSVNLDKEIIKAYCADFDSMLLASGRDKKSIKALKSARKCILDFALGIRKKQQEQPELWGNGEGKTMVVQEFKGATNINALAGLCREAEGDEAQPKKWDLGEKMNALIEKAFEEGYNQADIQKAFKELTAEPKAA